MKYSPQAYLASAAGAIPMREGICPHYYYENKKISIKKSGSMKDFIYSYPTKVYFGEKAGVLGAYAGFAKTRGIKAGVQVVLIK